MDALVQCVDAEQQLEVFGILIRFEVCKRLTGGGIVGVHGIDVRSFINAAEPLRHLVHHGVHMLLIGAEHDVLAGTFRHVLVEDDIQPVRLFQRAAESIQITFRFIAHNLAFRTAHTGFVAFQILLIGKHGQHIFRRCENTADDGLAQRDFGGDVAVEQLVRHVALVVQITDRRG